MAIGRTFRESFQKALRGLEIGVDGLDEVLPEEASPAEIDAILERELGQPRERRLWYVAEAFRRGWTLAELHEATHIDPWFLAQLEAIVASENAVRGQSLPSLDAATLRRLKREGFSDARLAKLLASRDGSSDERASEGDVREHRQSLGIRPVFKRVDSCAAEFASDTAYLYSTYETECEAEPSDRRKMMVLGGGPNRIGQGIEFDYCCVHAALALREDGYETIMVNCNPETVSTDFDTSDRLYFEPLTLEDVLAIIDVEQPEGVIVQYGGQTPLKLARSLEAAGAPIIGTSPDAIDLAEDRERFQQLIESLNLRQPPNRTARNPAEALRLADEIGYPLVVRPSYVLGGRAMEIVRQASDLERYMTEAVSVSNDSPVLLDRFLNDAIEVDVDAIADGERVVIGGIMQHIEEAGVHSGDSACSLPPWKLSADIIAELESQVHRMALGLDVVGLMNTQFAIQGDTVYVLEVNPRASRTVPFVSKATGVPLAKVAARCMAGKSLDSQQIERVPVPAFFNVKESVFPFGKFPGVDPLLGPEMKSTGEVMGSGREFGEAFYKALLAAGNELPRGGVAFVSVRDADKPSAVAVARQLVAAGFEIRATGGTHAAIRAADIACTRVNKLQQGQPHILDQIKNDEIDLVINTTEGQQAVTDSYYIRQETIKRKIPYTTTISGALAMGEAFRFGAEGPVYALAELHEEMQ